MRTFFQIHTDQPPGDVLIFLPGQEDIESLQASIKLYANQLPINEPAVRLFVYRRFLDKFLDNRNSTIFLTTGLDMYNVLCSRSFAKQQSFQSYTAQYPKVYSCYEYR